MNGTTSRPWFARRTVFWILSCGDASLLAATLVAAAGAKSDADRGGAEPYTPTKAEWLCVLLNSRQALINSERAQGGIAVHYLHDLAKPDVIRIQLFNAEGTGADQVHHRAERAKQQAMEAAKHRGWQNWLKIEVDEQKLTERFTADALIR